MGEYRWNNWNVDHIAAHGVTPHEAQEVVDHARDGYPRFVGDGKWLVHGRTLDGRSLRAIYVVDPIDPHDPDQLRRYFVIHAMPIIRRRKR